MPSNFAITREQLEIRDAVARLCERFGDDYWMAKDDGGGFPHEFHRAMAEAGWLGVAMPEEFGGSGLGITEAAIVMQAVAQSGAGFSGACASILQITSPPAVKRSTAFVPMKPDAPVISIFMLRREKSAQCAGKQP